MASIILRVLTGTVVGAALAVAAFSCSGTSSSGDGGADALADQALSDRKETDRTQTDRTVPTDGGSDGVAPEDGGGPYLVQLDVTPTAGGPSMLVPSFRPTTYDYYVQCSSGMNAFSVTMKASAGAESVLLQPKKSGAAPSQTVMSNVLENQAIVAAAEKGAATRSYWVRCLPADFPKMTWTVYEAGAPPGYYLLGNMLPSAGPGFAMILDGNGVPVWYHRDADAGIIDVDDIDGAVAFCPNLPPSSKASFEIHQLSPPSTSYAHPLEPDGGIVPDDQHELRVLGNGHYVLFTEVFQKGFDLTGLSVLEADGGLSPILATSATIQDCSIVEYDPKTGAVVWSWLGTDHFDPKLSTTILPAPQAPIYDVFHCNSIDVDPATGNILVSSRHMDSVFYIDKTSQKVVWKIGGTNASKDPGVTYVSVPSPFYRQHDARLQPGWIQSCNGGSGRLSVFDDESFDAAPKARAVVYDVVVGPGDGGAVTEGGCGDAGTLEGGTPGLATVSWQFSGTFPSVAAGSFRISSDGSRVIGWGVGGPKDPTFTEVDVKGNRLVELSFGKGLGSYRVVKVPPTAYDLAALRNAAGQ